MYVYITIQGAPKVPHVSIYFKHTWLVAPCKIICFALRSTAKTFQMSKKERAMSKLEIEDVHKRIAVVVCHENGMKTADISKATGVPLQTTQRAIERLEACTDA